MKISNFINSSTSSSEGIQILQYLMKNIRLCWNLNLICKHFLTGRKSKIIHCYFKEDSKNRKQSIFTGLV